MSTATNTHSFFDPLDVLLEVADDGGRELLSLLQQRNVQRTVMEATISKPCCILKEKKLTNKKKKKRMYEGQMNAVKLQQQNLKFRSRWFNYREAPDIKCFNSRRINYVD